MKADRAQPGNINEYIAGFPRPVRGLLRRVRAAIRRALPDAEEEISYRIPTYKLHGRPVIYFAGFMHHYSVYPANARLVAAFKRELAGYEYNNKGTIRFPLSEPAPETLIEAIARFRAKEVIDEQKAKAAAKKPRKSWSRRTAGPTRTA
jgi:uncharacterized protein YdhG (YjbR/CyaY superfamily)